MVGRLVSDAEQNCCGRCVLCVSVHDGMKLWLNVAADRVLFKSITHMLAGRRGVSAGFPSTGHRALGVLCGGGVDA